MEKINLSNVKINKNNIQLEFLYKSFIINENTCIFLEDKNGNKYNCDFIKSKNKVNYTYNDEEVEIAKVLINLDLSVSNFFNIKIKENGNISDVIILNNKNEEIINNNNPYTIFYKKIKINILNNGIEIESTKLFDKFKYEFNKQLYGISKFKKLFLYRFLKLKNNKYYLFNDRIMYGDDNAEELFKYINSSEKKFAKKCYFVLDKNSTSINRLKSIGKVVKYGSFKHKYIFLNSRIVISSHASYLSNCFNPFNIEEMEMYKDIMQRKFVFLQHGVIMNDVRQYLNRELISADLFVTSTYKENEYISSDDFMYDKNMVIKTGLPRFDKLENKTQKIILISPTWRSMEKNVSFDNSDYFVKYKSLLSNEKLNEMLKINNYKIKFLLHPVFAEYKSLFESLINKNIEILESSKITYSNLFNECALFITDYSSIHYDVATLKKPIIYYQFDRKYFFEHHYGSGYFDYSKDGFEKVISSENELIDEIKYYLNNNCTIRGEYKNKIEKTFMFLDKNNSKRVFEEIKKLDKNGDLNYRFNKVH